VDLLLCLSALPWVIVCLVTSRAVIVLGTSSQVPTEGRAQNGYALQWDQALILFDPGEGFHRQSLLAGVSIARADALLISHFHGDHCLGLPGVIHRRMLERPDDRLVTYYPAAGQPIFDMLTHATVASTPSVLDPCPIHTEGHIGTVARRSRRESAWRESSEPLDIVARRLEHPAPTLGYRIVEPDTWAVDAETLASIGIEGKRLGELQRVGELLTETGRLRLEDVQVRRRGQVMAFVMDTAPCEAAIELARDADLLVCEATFLDDDRELARASGHMTALDAGELARDAGVRKLVLTHFSSRYPDLEPFVVEAGSVHPDVIVARDLDRIPFPPRRGRTAGTPASTG
jgi:ribonuclease Z